MNFMIKREQFVKIGLILISIAVSFFALNAFAESNVVIVVNQNNKVDKLSKKDLQDFYLGEADKYAETKVKAKLCMNITVKDDFYKKIEVSENQSAANKAKLLAIGKNDKVITPKPVSTVADVVEYILRNADGGVCFIDKSDYEKLSDTDKKAMKVVFGQ